MIDQPILNKTKKRKIVDKYKKIKDVPGIEHKYYLEKYIKQTKIQRRALPSIYAGNNVVGISQTGYVFFFIFIYLFYI